MKKTLFISLISAIAALTFMSCGNDEPEMKINNGDDDTCNVSINVGVSAFEMIQDGYNSRATMPMGPEMENCIRTLTVIQFDEEGNMRQVPSDGKYYRFSTWTNVLYPQGVMSLNLNYTDFYAGESTICLIANIPEEEIEKIIYKDGNTSNPVNLNEFKKITVMMDYILPGQTGENEAEAGLMREIYMFGYYEGAVTEAQQLNIALARLVSRVDVAFSVADGATWDPDKYIYLSMHNLERNVHLWPVLESENIFWPDTEPAIYPVNMAEAPEQNRIIYFYSGPNSAANPSDATQLKVWYREKDAVIDKNNPDAVIYLCNSPFNENEADRNYQLNRNTFYRFNIAFSNKK